MLQKDSYETKWMAKDLDSIKHALFNSCNHCWYPEYPDIE